jgi:hypothetical protein
MDIWPRAADGQDMETRRNILITALRAAGLAATAPILSAAVPYVRLEGERDTLHGERRRISAEVENLYEQQGRAPAARFHAAILATWANLDRYPQSRRVAVHDLRARVATIAGSNSITLGDSGNGRQWFELAHRYARLSGEPSLISLAHARAANTAMYWPTTPRDAYGNIELARRYADTAELRALAAGEECRVRVLYGDAEGAARAADEAVRFANPADRSDRIDRCTRPVAHITISRAFARLPHLALAAEEHATEALRTLPRESDLLRGHALLDIAEARVRRRDISGALGAADRMLRDREHLEPVLRQRLAEVATMVEQRTGKRCQEIRRHV